MTLKKLGGGGLSPQQAVEQAINNPLPTIDELSSRSDIGVSQTEVQNAMADIASRQKSMNALATETKTADRVSTSQVGMAEIAASQTAMAEVANSQTAMAEVVASQVAMQDIAASQTAMAEVAASQIAMQEVAPSQTAIQEVVASQTAIQEVVASQTAMQEVAPSQTAMQEVANSQTAMQEVANSQTAMQEVANSQTAMTEIDQNDFAVRAIMCGTTSQDPTTFADADAISQDATAMAEIAGNETTMNAIAASQTAMQEIANSQTAINTIGSNTNEQITANTILPSSTATSEFNSSNLETTIVRNFNDGFNDGAGNITNKRLIVTGDSGNRGVNAEFVNDVGSVNEGTFIINEANSNQSNSNFGGEVSVSGLVIETN